MARAGFVTVKIRPLDAQAAAIWIEGLPVPLLGVHLSNRSLLPNGVSADLHKQLTAFGRRKRSAGGWVPAAIDMARDDAAWLAAQVRRGMFGAGRRRLVPPSVQAVCVQCAIAVGSRRGAPKLRGSGLTDAIARQHRNVSDETHAVDPRWLKRLAKRKREEEAMSAMFPNGSLLPVWPEK